ncbi:SIMPL domain-containing protein [Borrelia sp. CA_690]|uniref:SIMPL domain-containing protein n=1 Tax=Borrelia TaxID=138 RepID=UPI001E357A58|nr:MULTISPECIES: SIMPL domain-containing protein [Borrelia]WKC84217.1 SIMPL domain-containing protein [Borrelia sp. CA_690]
MLWKKDLFFLLLFLALLIIISYKRKNINTKNGSYIPVRGTSEKEIFLTSSSWNLQYDLSINVVNDNIKENNLNLSNNKIKNFFIKCGFNEDYVKKTLSLKILKIFVTIVLLFRLICTKGN